MPKKNGVMKTFSFSKETVEQIEQLGLYHKRTATNLIEKLIDEKYREHINGKDGKTEKGV